MVHNAATDSVGTKMGTAILASGISENRPHRVAWKHPTAATAKCSGRLGCSQPESPCAGTMGRSKHQYCSVSASDLRRAVTGPSRHLRHRHCRCQLALATGFVRDPTGLELIDETIQSL